MRRWLIATLLRIVRWLDVDRTVVHLTIDPTLVRLAQRLSADVERRYQPGFGDAKRRDLLALLMKSCPEAEKRDCALAIEIAVRS